VTHVLHSALRCYIQAHDHATCFKQNREVHSTERPIVLRVLRKPATSDFYLAAWVAIVFAQLDQMLSIAYCSRWCAGNGFLRQFLLQLRAIVDNKDGSVVDPKGHPLPPCIVMERGESLDIWSERAKPDRMQSFSVRPVTSLATSLVSLSVHAAYACAKVQAYIRTMTQSMYVMHAIHATQPRPEKDVLCAQFMNELPCPD
jgi:hypothetical protein